MLVRAFMTGVVGAALVALAGALARMAGIAFDLAWLQGSLLTGPDGACGAVAYALGLAMQLVTGGALGTLYAALLAAAPRPTPMAGGFIGLLHAMIAGVCLAAMPALHPAVPEAITAPGLLMIGRGALACGLFVLVHVAFGALMSIHVASPRAAASTHAVPDAEPAVLSA